MPTNRRKPAQAAEAWRRMFQVLMHSAPQRIEALQGHGLTPNDGRALFTIGEAPGTPIGTLARDWGNDPSTATWLVNRLERAGLAERHPAVHDRRIKLVRLTSKGAATKTALLRNYHQPPAELAELTSGELTELIRLLKLLQSKRADGQD